MEADDIADYGTCPFKHASAVKKFKLLYGRCIFRFYFSTSTSCKGVITKSRSYMSGWGICKSGSFTFTAS